MKPSITVGILIYVLPWHAISWADRTFLTCQHFRRNMYEVSKNWLVEGGQPWPNACDCMIYDEYLNLPFECCKHWRNKKDLILKDEICKIPDFWTFPLVKNICKHRLLSFTSLYWTFPMVNSLVFLSNQKIQSKNPINTSLTDQIGHVKLTGAWPGRGWLSPASYRGWRVSMSFWSSKLSSFLLGKKTFLDSTSCWFYQCFTRYDEIIRSPVWDSGWVSWVGPGGWGCLSSWRSWEPMNVFGRWGCLN